MLILSRKETQKILIGDNIWITVVKISCGQVKLAIDAPKETPISREELLDKPDKE